jgi:hypothetical protein
MIETGQTQPSFQADLAPIAVFAYNRRDRLAAMMQSLEQCEGFSRSPVIIFVDGPRGDVDRTAVDEVRSFVTGLSHPNVRHVISEINKGLRNSIFDGVSQIIAEYGRAIVLEDDLVLSPIGLCYFNQALDYYADDQRVWSISGYIPHVPKLSEHAYALILPTAWSWGWATWNRAWGQFDLDACPRNENIRAASFRQAMDMNGFYPFRFTLALSIAGRVDSWFVHWLYTIVRHGGRSIFPPRRVLDNFGISAGTHGGRFNPHDRLVNRPALLNRVPEFKDADEIDYFAADLLKRSWDARVLRAIPFAGAVKRQLRVVMRVVFRRPHRR